MRAVPPSADHWRPFEIVTPGTDDPVAPGEIGEVVVTALANADYPLIRFGTGDLSAFLPGPSPCGRTNARLRGWLGRADQATKVRGLFVHPSQVASIVRQHPEIRKVRLVVDLDAVTFLDSTGLGVLVGRLKVVHNHSGWLRVVCTQDRVLRVFRITGLDTVIGTHDALEGAHAMAPWVRSALGAGLRSAAAKAAPRPKRRARKPA